MKLMLRHKVIGLPVVAAVLPVLVMLVLTTIEKKSVTEKIEDQLDYLTRENIEHISLAVYNTCEATNKMIQKDLTRRLKDADGFFTEIGGLSLSSEIVPVKALIPATGQKNAIAIPKMLIEGLSEPGPYIDLIREKFGGNYGPVPAGSMKRATWC